MKTIASSLIAAALFVTAVSAPAQAQTEAVPTLAPVVVEAPKAKLEPEHIVSPMQYVEIRNFQDVLLGRVYDLGLDLSNGHIVEVLVTSDSSLDVDKKIVAVPPLALLGDAINQVYRINISAEKFKTAHAIDLSKWVDSGRSSQVAAAYRLFNQPIYFLEEGETASTEDRRPKVALGYVERSSRFLDMPITNLQNELLGKVWTLTLDIPSGRILSAVVVSQGNFNLKNVVPAMALSFNSARDGLILNDSPAELSREPRYLYTAAAHGQDAYAQEEAYTGPRTTETLAQGTSYRDVDQTVRINHAIRATGIDCGKIEVGTLHDRITLRGLVTTSEEKRRIGETTIQLSRPELVDNQLRVAPVATKG